MPQINPGLSRFGNEEEEGGNIPSVPIVASQCQLLSLYAIVTFPKALYVLESLQYGR